jgi:hypothetical protein
LIDNWRRLLQFQLAQRRVETQLRQTLAALERTVGGVLPGPRGEAVPARPVPPGE